MAEQGGRDTYEMDPGPMDESVLYLQSQHRSRYVWQASLQDVEVIMGLPVNGNPLTGKSKQCNLN